MSNLSPECAPKRTSVSNLRVHALIVTFASQTEASLGRKTIASYKPDRGINRLPVVLRQIGTTGKLAVHADPKSVV